jgi:hypothetical protein
MTAASLFASCGQRQQAKSVIKDFMEQSLQKDVKYLDFSDLDSTKAISDSVIMVMRQRGPKGIQYKEHQDETLLYLRTSYLDGEDTCSATFYLDREATAIVAFKQN